jgi:hypothetical protein
VGSESTAPLLVDIWKEAPRYLRPRGHRSFSRDWNSIGVSLVRGRKVLLAADKSWGGCMHWRWLTSNDDAPLWLSQLAATIFVTVIAAIVIAGLFFWSLI